MIRASLLCVLAGASAALTACDIPTATFDALSTGGAPGTSAAGATGGGGAATTTTSTASGGGGGGGAGAAGGAGAGGGGAGGTTTTTTTTTTTGTGGTGGSMGPVLQCNYPSVSDCMPGQVCCLDKTDPYQDKCASPGKCTPQSDYGEASCSSDAHCESGMHCCMYIVPNPGDPQYYDVQGMYCDMECAVGNNELPACQSAADCINSAPFFACKAVLGYSTYKFCQVP